jgi:hypothetical protein
LRQTDGISVKRNLKERLSESRTLINFSANLDIIQWVQEKKMGVCRPEEEKELSWAQPSRLREVLILAQLKKKILKEKKPGPI